MTGPGARRLRGFDRDALLSGILLGGVLATVLVRVWSGGPAATKASAQATRAVAARPAPPPRPEEAREPMPESGPAPALAPGLAVELQPPAEERAAADPALAIEAASGPPSSEPPRPAGPGVDSAFAPARFAPATVLGAAGGFSYVPSLDASGASTISLPAVAREFLKYKFREGERLIYSVDLAIHPAAPGTPAIAEKSEVTLTFVERVPPGDVLFDVISRLAGSSDPLSRQTSVVRRSRIPLSERGRVFRLPGLASDELIALPRLAEGAIAPGSSWSATQTFPIGSGSVTAHAEYQLESLSATVPGNAQPVTAVRASYEGLGGGAIDLDRNKVSGGKFWFDRHSGRVLELSATLHVKVRAPPVAGPSLPVGPARCEMKIALVRTEDVSAVPGPVSQR